MTIKYRKSRTEKALNLQKQKEYILVKYKYLFEIYLQTMCVWMKRAQLNIA